MTGKLYIDGKDAYLRYGVSVLEGGYNGLIAYPPLKSVEGNDWAEEDGCEFDLSSPVLDSREFNMLFAYTGITASVGSFFELLSDMAYHTFDIRSIGKTYRLRLSDQLDLSLISTSGKFTLKLANDFPLDGYGYQEPSSGLGMDVGYELDERNFSDYGLTILQGSFAEVLKSPTVKKNLLVNIDSKSGAIYDGEYVTFQTKDVKLNCLMRAKDLNEFWRNYNAFIYDLIRPGERRLYVDATGYEYPCYYKSCSVTDLSLLSDIWCQFSITLVFTSFRVEREEFLLASERDVLIITEQDDYAIDLSIYED